MKSNPCMCVYVHDFGLCGRAREVGWASLCDLIWPDLWLVSYDYLITNKCAYSHSMILNTTNHKVAFPAHSQCQSFTYLQIPPVLHAPQSKTLFSPFPMATTSAASSNMTLVSLAPSSHKQTDTLLKGMPSSSSNVAFPTVYTQQQQQKKTHSSFCSS
jgi:hypothetical protein